MSEFGAITKTRKEPACTCTHEDGMWLPQVAEELSKNGHRRYPSYGGTQKKKPNSFFQNTQEVKMIAV